MGANLVETLVGAVVLLVAGFFLVFAYQKSEVAQVQGYPLIAKFEKVDGIRVGADVTLGGIKIGSVADETLDLESYLAVLRLAIREDVKLPEDSSIKVTSDGLLGSKYLAVQPGGAEAMLPAGGEIRYTQGAVDLTELLGKAIYSSGGGSGQGKSP